MKKTFWIAAILCLAPSFSSAVGIAMRFMDVTLEYVEPGANFNLRALKNLPLIVINKDEKNPTDIVIESIAPEPKEMKEGYEPIPDPSWVRALPNHFTLGPKASASADIIVTIPNDPALIGKHFEVVMWVHTENRDPVPGQGGVYFRAGLRSRLRMSIGTKGPAALQREKMLKKLATIDINFAVNPDNLFATSVPVGREIDLKSEKHASLKIVNQGDTAIRLKVHSIPSDSNIEPQAGYVYAPDPKWLQVSTPEMNVPGNAIKELKLRLLIPDQPEYRGKKYMFLVQTTLADDSLPLTYNNMVYVTTQP